MGDMSPVVAMEGDTLSTTSEHAPVFSFHGSDTAGRPKWMAFPCQGQPPRGTCQIALRPEQKNAVGASWRWDGNREAPTITPSINCEKICGWHGYITAGKFSP